MAAKVPGPSAAELWRRVATREAAQILRYDADARHGDVEAIHQIRVASRRLRSSLRPLGEVLSLPQRRLERDLEWLAGQFQLSRDLEMTARLLRDFRFTQRARVSSVIDEVIARDASRAARRQSRALESGRYRDVLSRVVVEATRPRRGAGERALSVVAPGLNRDLGRFVQRAAEVYPEPTDESLHRLRLAAKRVRYGIEVAALCDDSFTGASGPFEAVQDALSHVHDRAVTALYVREIAGESEIARVDDAGVELAVFTDWLAERDAEAESRWRTAMSSALAYCHEEGRVFERLGGEGFSGRN